MDEAPCNFSNAGEAARQPDAPKLSGAPIDLFTFRDGEGSGYSWKDKNFFPVSMGALGITVPIVYNYLLRRPLWSGNNLILTFDDYSKFT